MLSAEELFFSPGLVNCRHTKVGGWAEFVDFDMRYYSEDGTLKPEHHSTKWIANINDACRKMGRESSPGPLLEGWLRDAGYKNIWHKVFPLPLGMWPKDPSLVSVHESHRDSEDLDTP
jgi:hypothetical protein